MNAGNFYHVQRASALDFRNVIGNMPVVYDAVIAETCAAGRKHGTAVNCDVAYGNGAEKLFKHFHNLLFVLMWSLLLLRKRGQ